MLLIFNVVTLRFISNLAIIIFFESTQICYWCVIQYQATRFNLSSI